MRLSRPFHIDLLALGQKFAHLLLLPGDDIGPVGFRFHSPDALSFQLREVATENLVTAAPDGVKVVSASLPNRPTMMTLFTLRSAMIMLPFLELVLVVSTVRTEVW